MLMARPSVALDLVDAGRLLADELAKAVQMRSG
jgi:hypothetical protein